MTCSTIDSLLCMYIYYNVVNGELDRIGEVMEAVGDRERGAGVEHERSC